MAIRLPEGHLIDPAQLSADLDEGWGLPASYYHDPAIYRFELEAVWRREWQYIGPAANMQRVGDVMIGYAGDIPVVVTRAEDGALHGFVNVCRHRGYRVQREDTHKCRRLVCGYHAWSYRLDGRLANAPGSEDVEGFQADELGLRRVAVDEWGHGIYVNADLSAGSRLDYFPGQGEEVARIGIDMDPERYSLSRSSEHHVASNWKMWFDNFVECYHCDNIHAQSFSAAYDSDIKTVDTRFFGRFQSNHFGAKPGDSGTELRADNYRSSVSFPGCLILQQDHLMILSQMRPTGPESTIQLVHYFGERGSDPGLVDRWIDLWEETFNEDGAATAIQQEGFRTGALERNRLVSSREEAVIVFNKATCQTYKRYLDSTQVSEAAE